MWRRKELVQRKGKDLRVYLKSVGVFHQLLRWNEMTPLKGSKFLTSAPRCNLKRLTIPPPPYLPMVSKQNIPLFLSETAWNMLSYFVQVAVHAAVMKVSVEQHIRSPSVCILLWFFGIHILYHISLKLFLCATVASLQHAWIDMYVRILLFLFFGSCLALFICI